MAEHMAKAAVTNAIVHVPAQTDERHGLELKRNATGYSEDSGRLHTRCPRG
jgi:hypothetical protein